MKSIDLDGSAEQYRIHIVPEDFIKAFDTIQTLDGRDAVVDGGLCVTIILRSQDYLPTAFSKLSPLNGIVTA